MVVYERNGIYSVTARCHGQGACSSKGFPFLSSVLMPVAYVCFIEKLYIQDALGVKCTLCVVAQVHGERGQRDSSPGGAGGR